jgi:hypothetical protein
MVNLSEGIVAIQGEQFPTEREVRFLRALLRDSGLFLTPQNYDAMKADFEKGAGVFQPRQ